MNRLNSFAITSVLCLQAMTTTVALAQESEDTSFGSTAKPHIVVNVGLDIRTVEQATASLNESSAAIAQALNRLAERPGTSAEQQRNIDELLTHVEAIVEQVHASIEAIPMAVERGGEPVLELVGNAIHKLERLLWTTAGTLLLLILLALLGCYLFAIRPIANAVVNTAGKLRSMSEALEKTAMLVEQTNKNLAAARQRLPGTEPPSGTLAS